MLGKIQLADNRNGNRAAYVPRSIELARISVPIIILKKGIPQLISTAMTIALFFLPRASAGDQK
jgi:hypothetical protein